MSRERRPGAPAPANRGHHNRPRKPPLRRQISTLWDYPSRTYGLGRQGDDRFKGASPAWLVWDLVTKFTSEGGLVIDPFCGSGTTLDVCKELGRRSLGFDVSPVRDDIQQADARSLPVKSSTADLVFMDPPYADNLVYSDDPRCLGRLPARDQRFDRALDLCFAEAQRVLKPGGTIAVYICDIYHHGSGFYPLGFRAFDLLKKRFLPIDIVAVVRRNASLEAPSHRNAAEAQAFLLRGFNYLLLLQKSRSSPAAWSAPH